MKTSRCLLSRRSQRGYLSLHDQTFRDDGAGRACLCDSGELSLGAILTREHIATNVRHLIGSVDTDASGMLRSGDLDHLEASPGLPPRWYSAEIPLSPSNGFSNDHVGASPGRHCAVNFRSRQFHNRNHFMSLCAD